MPPELDGSDERRIRVHTLHGTVEGTIHTNSGVSTMHYLNVAASVQEFLTLHPPLTCSSHWMLDEGPLAVAVDSILFAVERSEFTPRPGDPREAAQFQRTAIRLRLADHVVDGFMHVPPGADPINRLNQNRHPFVALTVVSVMGPHEQFAASFLAANRRYITAVQEIAAEPDVSPRIFALDRPGC